jgi:hypothetical protein
MEDSISFTISPEDLQAVKDMIASINELLEPYLITLSPEERDKLLEMSEECEPFVAKVMDYAVTNPEFLPPFVQIEDVKKDWHDSSSFLSIFRSIQKLESNLSDTVRVISSDAFETALNYFRCVKIAANMDVPNSQIICDDLNNTLEGKENNKPKPNEEI